MAFKPYYDKSLGATVHSERERQKLAAERGLADPRDWDSPESLERERREKRKEARNRRDSYLDKPIEHALARANDGQEFESELERDIMAAEEKEEARREAERAAREDREREFDERRAWEEKRGR